MTVTDTNAKRPFFIPDLCQTATLLMLILVTELFVLAWTLAGGEFSYGLLGMRSLTVQWIALLSAAGLCQLRGFLHRFSERQGWWLCLAVIVFVGLVVLVPSHLYLYLGVIDAAILVQQVAAVALIGAMALRFFQLLRQVLEHNQAELSSRMDALQARIKPHFLFNSLNTIAELIATRPQEAEHAVENLSTLFRANLKETGSLCPLEHELTLVKGYLTLEAWRLGDRLQVTWEESVHDPNWPVPVLCLQPLVENAVVHGIASRPQGGEIRIQVLQSPRKMTLSVENPFEPEGSSHKGHGVGLDNVQRRLNVLYGYSARCSVDITKDRYKVSVIVPRSALEPDL